MFYDKQSVRINDLDSITLWTSYMCFLLSLVLFSFVLTSDLYTRVVIHTQQYFKEWF